MDERQWALNLASNINRDRSDLNEEYLLPKCYLLHTLPTLFFASHVKGYYTFIRSRRGVSPQNEAGTRIGQRFR